MNEHSGRKLSLTLTALASCIYAATAYALPHILNGIGFETEFAAVLAALKITFLLTVGAAVAHLIKFDGSLHYMSQRLGGGFCHGCLYGRPPSYFRFA